MNYSPKSKPGFFHWLADPLKILMGTGLLTILGVLVFFFSDSINTPPPLPKNVPVINPFPFGNPEQAARGAPIGVPVAVNENPDDPIIPIEEFAVGKPFANHHSSKRLGVSMII